MHFVSNLHLRLKLYLFVKQKRSLLLFKEPVFTINIILQADGCLLTTGDAENTCNAGTWRGMLPTCCKWLLNVWSYIYTIVLCEDSLAAPDTTNDGVWIGTLVYVVDQSWNTGFKLKDPCIVDMSLKIYNATVFKILCVCQPMLGTWKYE